MQKPRVLIIVQNLPVPFDRRVWLECRALTGRGYQVTVVCPKAREDPARAVLEGVTLLKYRPYAPGGSAASFIAGVRLLVPGHGLAGTERPAGRGRFDVLQACNPPDIFWPIARWLTVAQDDPFRLRPP